MSVLSPFSPYCWLVYSGQKKNLRTADDEAIDGKIHQGIDDGTVLHRVFL